MRSKNLKIFLIAVLLSILSLTTSCLKYAADNNFKPISNPAEKVTSDFPANLSNEKAQPSTQKQKSNISLVCSPNKVRLGETLVLTMKQPHGGYLEVVTPKKRRLFLSEADGDELVEDGKRSGAEPIFAATEFAKLTELEINTAKATTVDYDKNKIDGEFQLSKIFVEPGKYKILLSLDSFEQDDPTIMGKCVVELTK